MLFHTPEFLFIFLPLTLAGYFFCAWLNARAAFVWLGIASLFFYGYWNVGHVPLILASIVLNYLLGSRIAVSHQQGRLRRVRTLMWIGVVINTGALIYFKYFVFLAAQLTWATQTVRWVPDIVLPIGISFYTFTQIAFLVDASRGLVNERNFVNYLLFVTYFPHLVAGPLLHHKEMMPQFADRENTRPNALNLAAGLTFLALGMFKKVVIADGLAPTVGEFFDGPAALEGSAPRAWGAAIAYTLQLYFDFSGYSDMAIGLSLMFNVRLPVNFDSPYRASSIIEFWRRWHMTLSRFLRDYVYVGLGGNRRGRLRRHVNLFATMLLGGLWHGANWTFVVWGAMHGAFLIVNHAWRAFVQRCPGPVRDVLSSRWMVPLYVLVTFLSVVVAWVVFRSPSVTVATSVLGVMLSTEAFIIPAPDLQNAWLLLLLGWVAFVPNTNQVMRYTFGTDRPHATGGGPLTTWRPAVGWAFTVAFLMMTTLLIAATQREKLEFLYFQF